MVTTHGSGGAKRADNQRKAGDARRVRVLSDGCRAKAADLLHGAAWVEELTGGFVRPWRFLLAQRRALESCMAWYPGIYRQMARCTSGIALEFETDARHVELEVRLDPEPKATRDVLRALDGEDAAGRNPHDGISVDMDGCHQDPVLPELSSGRDGALGASILSLDLDRPHGSRGAGVRVAGGDGGHHVRVWLPALRGCELRDVWGDGSFIRPVSSRPRLLVLGDSLSQGYVVGDPALAWPSVAARALGCDVLNQSVGGQVFQPTSLVGLGDLDAPERVVVFLGANYRYGRCSERIVRREVFEYLDTVDRLLPASALLVVRPAAPSGESVVRGSCAAAVPGIVAEAFARVRARRLERHGAACLLVPEADIVDSGLVVDEDGHPSLEGSLAIASAMERELRKLECACLRDFGTYGRCGACRGELTGEPFGSAADDDHAAGDAEAGREGGSSADEGEPIDAELEATLARMEALEEAASEPEPEPEPRALPGGQTAALALPEPTTLALDPMPLPEQPSKPKRKRRRSSPRPKSGKRKGTVGSLEASSKEGAGSADASSRSAVSGADDKPVCLKPAEEPKDDFPLTLFDLLDAME